MRFAFRTDASSQIGSGHVMRCLTLADALHEQGAECQFICRELEGHMMSLIEQRDYPVKGLPAPTNTFNSIADPAHAAWLGCDWKEDAEQTQHAIGANVVDWLIVDHYALNRRWHQALRPSTKHLMVIDDLADRLLDCDLLLDQNYGSSAARYAGLVPQHCPQLHGPDYALLKPVYAERRAKMRQRSGEIQRVLIYFGAGADHADYAGQAVRAFDHQELADIHLDVVVSAAYAHLSSLQAFAAQRGNVSLHSQLPDLADLMAQADLAIGAGGATTWERCCMGLPSIVISIAENQRPACEALARAGLIRYLGDGLSVSVSEIQSVGRELSQDSQQMRALSSASMKLVDGKGVHKVAEAISAINGVEMSEAQMASI
jgi:UDP-2,4-diacetamido-2,4,6-trideoxy-beta-L-altropyranose hydrolase